MPPTAHLVRYLQLFRKHLNHTNTSTMIQFIQWKSGSLISAKSISSTLRYICVRFKLELLDSNGKSYSKIYHCFDKFITLGFGCQAIYKSHLFSKNICIDSFLPLPPISRYFLLDAKPNVFMRIQKLFVSLLVKAR